MKTEDTLCVVVDIQQRLMPAMDRHAELIQAGVTLLQGLQALNVPIIATEQYPKGLGQTVGEVRAFVAENKIFEKTRFSALLPAVRAMIAEQKIENVILIGAEAHVCMLQTALELRAAKLNVYVPFECTASRSSLNKENALQQMRAAGVCVSNVESILFALLGDANHPAFKTIAKLIV